MGNPAFKTASDWPEPEYRKAVSETLGRVMRAFEAVDPDQAECEMVSGVLAIVFADRTKIILSAQPAVRQLWLALAAKGTAYHFGWDAGRGEWRDDKGRDIEALSLLAQVLSESAGMQLKF
jgi:iron donor protein CyaY